MQKQHLPCYYLGRIQRAILASKQCSRAGAFLKGAGALKPIKRVPEPEPEPVLKVAGAVSRDPVKKKARSRTLERKIDIKCYRFQWNNS